MILEIAWKNIWRNKTRSLVVMVAILIGMFGGIFASSILRGMFTQRVQNALKLEIPHIQVNRKGFTQNNDILYNIPQASKYIKKIEGISGVKTVTARTCLTSMVSTAHNSLGVTTYGVNAQKERAIFDLHKTIPDSLGSFLPKGKSNSIVIGKKLSKKLKVHTNSKIVLTFQSAQGDLVGGAFRVSGIYQTNNSSMDESVVFVNNVDLTGLTAMTKGATHEILLRLEDGTQIETIKKQVEDIVGPEYEVKTWSELRPDVGMMIDLMEMMSTMILMILLIALGFGIANTMFMVVLERTKELGMLIAVGMSRFKVFCLILLETLMLTFVGSTLGILLSNLVVSYYSKVGINLQGLNYERLGIDSFVYPSLALNDYVTVGILVFLTGIISAIFPARRTLKMNPADIIRN